MRRAGAHDSADASGELMTPDPAGLTPQKALCAPLYVYHRRLSALDRTLVHSYSPMHSCASAHLSPARRHSLRCIS